MGKSTDISWTDHTFNPWWGCFKVSAGCTNCYAETFAKRVGQQIWGPPDHTERRLFGDKHWAEPLHWNAEAEKAGVRRRVFCASMADVFEDHPQLPPVRRRLWNLIEDTPHLDWLLLTKRPENIATMLPQKYWPNVWLGTSTEDQQRADERVPVLLRYRELAPVLFLSAEPLLGPIDLSRWLSPPRYNPVDGSDDICGERRLPRGSIGRTGDRQSREDLASCGSSRGPLEGRESLDSVSATASGARHTTGLSSGSSDVEREAKLRGSTPSGLQAFLWTYPGGNDGQSQERPEDGQSTGESVAGDGERAGPARDYGAKAGTLEPEWRAQPDGQIERPASGRDQTSSPQRRIVECDRGGFRDSLPARVADCEGRPPISWLIVGGESGPRHRPFNPDWARGLRDQCAAANIAYFFKQHGGRTHAEGGCELDGREHKAFPERRRELAHA